MFAPPLVHYIVVHEVTGRRGFSTESEFQLFSWEWMTLHSTIATILQGPACIVDIVGSVAQRIETRFSGMARYNILTVGPAQLVDISPIPFMVLVTTSDTDALGREYVQQHGPTTLHLPANPLDGETGLTEATSDTYRRWVDVIVTELEKTDPENAEVIRQIPRPYTSTPTLPMAVLPMTEMTLASDLTIVSTGVSPWRERERSDGDASIDNLLMRSYEQVRTVRRAYFRQDLYPPGATEFLIVTAGMARDLPAVVPKAARTSGDEVWVRTWNRVRQTDCFLLPPACDVRLPEVAADLRALDIVNEREGEFQAQLLAAAVEACGQILPTVPVIRSMSSSHQPLGQLARCLRDRPSDWQKKACAFAQRAGRQIASALPQFLLRDLAEIRGTVKAISDEPIELLQLDGKPLSVIHPVVRLPATPGFLLESLLQLRAPIVLGPQDFQKLLIVRGTKPADPVYPLLERFAQRIAKRSQLVDVSIVDVRTIKEFGDALNAFQGAMVVFDGHGTHTERSGGRLVIGDETADFVQISRELRFPPIAFLAACDTFPPDRATPTVAHSLLVAGATTVVATLGPVGAVESAVLVADLLAFALHYVPICPGAIRWSELFWLASSTAHVAEGILELRRRGFITATPQEVERLATMVAKRALLMFQADWLEQVWKELAQTNKKSLSEIAALWNQHAYVTDSVLHCQLGQADMIFLAPSNSWAGVEQPKPGRPIAASVPSKPSKSPCPQSPRASRGFSVDRARACCGRVEKSLPPTVGTLTQSPLSGHGGLGSAELFAPAGSQLIGRQIHLKPKVSTSVATRVRRVGSRTLKTLAGNEVCEIGRSFGFEGRTRALGVDRPQHEQQAQPLELRLRALRCLGQQADRVFELLPHPGRHHRELLLERLAERCFLNGSICSASPTP